MEDAAIIDDGEWMSKGQALRLAVAALSGPVIVLSLLKVDWQPLEVWAGPLWLDAEELVVEALHAYWLTLMVVTSLCVRRVLLPARSRPQSFFYPLMLWGLQSTFSVYGAFFNLGHWQAEYVLFLGWLLGLVTFGVLGLVLALTVLGTVARENGRWALNIGLAKIISAGVIVATVFLDWALLSTQATELSVLPILDLVEDR